MKEIALAASALVVFIAAVIGLGLALDSAGCYASWADSGREVRFGVWSGCQVTDRGHWVPDHTVRVTP